MARHRKRPERKPQPAPELEGADSERLTVKLGHAAYLLGFGVDKTRRLVQRGDLESFLSDKERMVTMASIKAYVARKLAETDSVHKAHENLTPFPRRRTPLAQP